MKTVYLDNAATTPIAKEVIDKMQHSMTENFGNPSSTHQFGRSAKNSIETARKNIASHFNVSASEIIFTAGGTEADNLILRNAVLNLGVKKIITTKIEHHAVLHVVENLVEEFDIEVDFLSIDAKGDISLFELESLLKNSKKKTLVSLMYINNETGNILPLKRVSSLCVEFDAYFHSDTVQAIGHYIIDLEKTPIDFITASAHKFHGAKGVGFAYFKKGIGIKPMLLGGNQEKGARSGTENLHSIIGMNKALDLAFFSMKEDEIKMNSLKTFFIKNLKQISSDIQFNGQSSNLEFSSCTILNVRFPMNNTMFLFSLDMLGIAVSGGSACQSGTNKGSHVLTEILSKEEADKTSIRFSFSRYTTKEDLIYTIEMLKTLL